MQIRHLLRLRWRDGYSAISDLDHLRFTPLEEVLDTYSVEARAPARVVYTSVPQGTLALLLSSAHLTSDGGRPATWRHGLLAVETEDGPQVRARLGATVRSMYGENLTGGVQVLYGLLSCLPRSEGAPLLTRHLEQWASDGPGALFLELIARNPNAAREAGLDEARIAPFLRSRPPLTVLAPRAGRQPPDRPDTGTELLLSPEHEEEVLAATVLSRSPVVPDAPVAAPRRWAAWGAAWGGLVVAALALGVLGVSLGVFLLGLLYLAPWSVPPAPPAVPPAQEE